MKKRMKKVDDWMETHLPWILNNGIKWAVGVPFMPFMVVFGLIFELTIPFRPETWDGRHQVMWPWEWHWPWRWDED